MTATMFTQIGSVLIMETIGRFRRPSTVILFLILCGTAFLMMPDGTGGVMFLIGSRRVFLNSAATSLTSALMGGLILSLLGFYLISNSVARDSRTGVGRLIAATPLSSARYLAGKLAGNIVYMTALVFVFMIACMGMHILRGEAALEPMVYIRTFGIMFLPMIPTVAAIALMFECVPVLSGRGGDMLYFFIWVASLGFTVAIVHGSNSHPWILTVDITGLGFFIEEIRSVMNTSGFSIGYAPFDASLPPAFFGGLQWLPEYVVPRLASTLVLLPVFLIALISFRRFDPARKSRGKMIGNGRLSRLSRTLASVGRRIAVPRGGWMTGHPSFVKNVFLDVRLTASLNPFFMLLTAFACFFSLIVPLEAVRSAILPVIFFILIPSIAPISTRDRIGNVTRLLFSAPRIRKHFVSFKLFSAFLSAFFLCIVPVVRLCLSDPFGAFALFNGLFFIAASATALGFLTRTPKTFVSLFLLFLYAALGAKGAPGFDFAGFQGIVTFPVILAYTATGCILLVVAWGVERYRNA